MFDSKSMTGVSVIVYLIALDLQYIGVDGIENEAIAAFVLNVAEIVSFVGIIVGQLRRKDLKFGLVRR